MERRARLDGAPSFEDIAKRLDEQFHVTSVRAQIGHDKCVTGCGRLRALIAADCHLLDQFFNSRDGYRGRYWQSCEAGERSNRRIIRSLIPKITEFLHRHPDCLAKENCTLSHDEAIRSLNGNSAKVWVEHQDAHGAKIARSLPHLVVQRWEQLRSSPKGFHGCWAPIFAVLDLKGAFFDSDGSERVPERKKDRSRQLHDRGFS